MQRLRNTDENMVTMSMEEEGDGKRLGGHSTCFSNCQSF